MMPRLVIITEIISPYRIPLFNALHKGGAVNLHVIFLAETDPSLRQWHVRKDDIAFSHQVLPAWRRRLGSWNLLLNRNLCAALTDASPDVVLCGGYNYLAAWQALHWARTKRVPFLLWSESNVQDARGGHAAVELLKAAFIQRCDGFLVPGHSASDYLRGYKIPEHRIFTAVNAVDNVAFARAAARARENAQLERAKLGLPRRYFLFAGRLVREKGVFDLLDAYAKLNEHVRAEVGLVMLGDGPAREQLHSRATSVSPGDVVFTGFVEQQDLGKYYGAAEMLILPTHSDTWGLVVNEAMASGLPIILSRVAGCAADLVTENWNGFLVPPSDVPSLSAAMERLATQQSLRTKMGANSLQRISLYSPEQWSAGVMEAVHAVVGAND